MENKSKDKKYQAIDIDFIATKANDCRRIEVKMDNKEGTTGNLLLEVITNTISGNLGWFSITQADFIFFHDTINNQLLTVETSDLWSYLAMPGCKAYYKTWKTFEGYGYKTAEGWLVPMHEYIKHFPIGEQSLGGNPS